MTQKLSFTTLLLLGAAGNLSAAEPGNLANNQVGAGDIQIAKTNEVDTTGLAASRPEGQLRASDAVLAAKGDGLGRADRENSIQASGFASQIGKGVIPQSFKATSQQPAQARGAAGESSDLPKPSRLDGRIAAGASISAPRFSKREPGPRIVGSFDATITADKSISN